MESLEPRILLSADSVMTALPVAGPDNSDPLFWYNQKLIPAEEVQLFDNTQVKETSAFESYDPSRQLDDILTDLDLQDSPKDDWIVITGADIDPAQPSWTLNTGDSDDTVLIYDVDFAGVDFVLDTGGGQDRVFVYNSRFDADLFNIDLGSGDDTLLIRQSQFDVESLALDGGGGSDILGAQLLDDQAETQWRVDSLNAGTVDNLPFSGFENLAGGVGNRDVFVIGADGDLDGSVRGGAGGDDELVIADQGDGAKALTHTLKGGQGGTFTSADGSVAHDYDGFERVIFGPEAESQTITLSNDANLTLAQTVDGNLVAMIQYAFDAQTDLSGLDGTDGFAVTGSTADGNLGYAVSRAGDVNADGFDDVIIGVPGLDLAYVLFGSDQGFDAALDPASLDGTNGFVLNGPAGQNVGYAVGGGGDVNGDGFDDVIVGAPGPDGDFSAGTSYVVFGTDQGFSASIDLTGLDGTNGFSITGIAVGDASGYAVAIVGDVNGDSLGEVLIGAPGADPDGLVDAGQAYLLFGRDSDVSGFEATVSLTSLDGRTGFAFDGAAAGDALGSAVAAAGDINSDFLTDIVLGAPGADANGADSGAAYVFFGAPDYAVAQGLNGLYFDTGPVTTLADAQAAIAAATPTATFFAYRIDYPNSDDADTADATTSLSDFLGLNVEELSGGDADTVDGSVFVFDGYLYVAEAGTYTFEVGSAEGFSLTIDGDTVAEFDGTRDFDQTSGTHSFAEAGFYALSLLYFTDDDPAGIELKSDLVTTDRSLDFISREYLFNNPATAAYPVADLDGNSGFTIAGEAAGDALGTAVGTAGDVNADDAVDVIVGAPGSDGNGTDSGRAYVVFGRSQTTLDDGFAASYAAGELDADTGLILTGAVTGARAGSAVGTAGDLNADGVSDAVIGAPGADSGMAGSVQVVFGDTGLGDNGPLDLGSLDGVTGFSADTGIAGDGLGSAVAFAGDVNGDGDDDLIVGAPTSAGAGAAVVLFGRVAGGATTTVDYGTPASEFVIDGVDAQANITLGAAGSAALLGDDINSDILHFDGSNVDISGKTVNVKAGMTVSTRQIDPSSTDYANAISTGNSGAITLAAKVTYGRGSDGSVTIGKGASLYAHVQEGSAFSAGDVSITADHSITGVPSIPVAKYFNEGGHHAHIDIDEGVNVLGAAIDITSTAGTIPLSNAMSTLPGFASGFLQGALNGLSPYLNLISLPLAIQISDVNATIDIGQSDGKAVTIQGSGNVSVGADAFATAKGDALMWYSIANKYSFAVGVWVAHANSHVILNDNVTVESTGSDVAISSNSTTAAGGRARVTQNIEQAAGDEADKPDNPDNIAVAVGVADTSTTARVTVEADADVVADQGNVALTSTGSESVLVFPATRSYKDGKVGVTVAVQNSYTDIRTLIKGTVSAGGAQVGETITFDPFTALDTAADTLDVGVGHGYRTGDAVVYSPDLGGAIDGLQASSTYYVIVVDNSDNLIQLAASEDDAQAGVAIDFRDNPTLKAGGGTLVFTQIGEASNTITFSSAHGLIQGEAVVYHEAQGKRIGGLTDGQTYYVVPVDGDDTQLQLATDAAGTDIVDLDASPVFTVQATGQELVVASVDPDSGVITFTEDHGLSAGDAIVLHPALGSQLADPLSGERYADGTVFYAVPSPSADDPTQTDPTQIRLAATQQDAEASNGYTHTLTPRLDTLVMSGTQHTLTPTLASGITATATMTGQVEVEAAASLGGNAGLVKRYTQPEFFSKGRGWLQSFYNNSFGKLDKLKNNGGPLGNNADTSQQTLDFAASFGWLYVSRTVETVIGSTAVLTSGAGVAVKASTIETGNIDLEAGASQSKKSEIKVDIGAAVGITLYDATVRAVVNDGAKIDAMAAITVDAENQRRFPAPINSPDAFGDFLVEDLVSSPTTFVNDLNGDLLGIAPIFTTGWVSTSVSPEVTTTAVAFAMHVGLYTNVTEAIIATGAQINQNTNIRSDDQAVTVNARNRMYLVDMAGVFEFGFNVENITNWALDRYTSLNRNSSPLASVGVEGKSYAAGAALQWIDITNRTRAEIGVASPVDDQGDAGSVSPSGDVARVHTGSGENKGLNVTAHDEIWHFSFVDSAAKTDDGKFAFAGSGALFFYNADDNGDTTAAIGAGTKVTGGSVTVKATDQLILVHQNGDLITGDSTGSVGVGLNYLEIHRRLNAYIGDFDGTSTLASSFDLDPGATINVEARSSGFVLSFVLAGTVRTDPPPKENDDGQQDAPAEAQAGNGNGANSGKSGWSLAGDASVIDLVADQVLAFIDDTGTLTADKISVTASNVNAYINLAGAFSVAKEGYDSGSNTGLAGSFAGIELHRGDADSLGRYDSDTLAYIRRATVTAGVMGLQMTAYRRGVYWVTAAGGSGVSQGSGVEVAGSAAWTDLDYATRAYLDEATVTLAGDSSMSASDRVATIAFAGDGVYHGSVGFGTSWAWNHVDRRVHATITNSAVTQSAGTLSLDAVVWDIATHSGQTFLPSAYAVAATLGLGQQKTTIAELTGTVAVNEFNKGTSDPAVEASMTGSAYKQPDEGASDTTGLSLSAKDNTNLLALAGAVDTNANFTVGVAAAVNTLEDKARASIESSTVDVNNGDVAVLTAINPEMNAFALGVSVTDSTGVNFAGSGASNTAPLTADSHIQGQVDLNGETDTKITGAANITIDAKITYTDVAAGAGQFGYQKDGYIPVGAGLGAAVAVNDLSENSISTYVQDAALSASGAIDVTATTGMATGGIILAVAVGGEGAENFTLGGSVVVNTVAPTTDAHVSGDAATLSAGDDITVSAKEKDLVVASGAGVISDATSSAGGAAIGAAVATNTVNSPVTGYVEDAPSVTSTGGSVTVSADRDSPQIVAVALGADKAQDFALGGSVATNTVTHTTDAHVTGGAQVQGAAEVSVQATEESPVIVAAAGNFAISSKGVAIGAAVPTNTVTRDLTAYVGDKNQSDFDEGADGASLSSSAGAVTVSATRTDSLLLAIGVSGVGAQTFSLGGSVVETNIKSSTVDAHVWGGDLDGNQGVTIQAGDTGAINAAGAGNLDLSYLFQSSGSKNGNSNAVQQPQESQKDATEEAQKDLDNEEEVSDAEQAVDDKIDQVEQDDPEQKINPLQDASDNIDDFYKEYDNAVASGAIAAIVVSGPATGTDDPVSSTGSTGASIGLALANNLAKDGGGPTVTAFASDSKLTSDAGSIHVLAEQKVLFVTFAGSGSVSENTVNIDGTEATTVYRPVTRAYIDASGATLYKVNAAGNVIVAADSIVHAVTFAGNLAYNAKGTSVALTFATVDHKTGTTEAYIDHADVTALGNTADDTVIVGQKGDKASNNAFRGVSVTATSRQVFTTVAAGIEVAGKFNIAASTSINLVGSLSDNLTTRAYVGENVTVNQDNSGANARQSLNIFAYSDTIVQGGGGAFGVSTGKNLGAGAGVDGGQIYKTTEAYLSAGTVNAANVVAVQAYADDYLLSFSGSVQLSKQSSELAGALGVYLWDVTTNAYIGSAGGGGSTKTVRAGGSVLLAANNDTNILLIAGAVELTGGTASVGASVAVNELTGHTSAYISDDAQVTALAGDNTDTIAAAVGGYAISFSDDGGDPGSTVAPPGSTPTTETGDGELSADDPAWTRPGLKPASRSPTTRTSAAWP